MRALVVQGLADVDEYRYECGRGMSLLLVARATARSCLRSGLYVAQGIFEEGNSFSIQQRFSSRLPRSQ